MFERTPVRRRQHEYEGILPLGRREAEFEAGEPAAEKHAVLLFLACWQRHGDIADEIGPPAILSSERFGQTDSDIAQTKAGRLIVAKSSVIVEVYILPASRSGRGS